MYLSFVFNFTYVHRNRTGVLRMRKLRFSVFSVDNPQLTNILPLKPVGGQNIAAYASPTARIVFFIPRNFYLPGPFTFIFSPNSLHTEKTTTVGCG